MKRLWKETLLPGTQVDAKSKRPFTISDADVLDARRNISRMVKKGRRIPLVWEHVNVEESDEDDWKARYAKHTFGWVGGAKLSTAEDVRSGLASRAGTLLVRHDVHDDKDVEQLKRTGYVSPKIYRGYLDSQGEPYSGVTVAHIAASPTVCQWWQAPFSHELSATDALCLTYELPEEADEKPASCPSYDAFHSWLDGIDLSTTAAPDEDAPVADETDDKGKKSDAPEGGADGDFKALVAALKAKGMTISDRVKDIPGLIIAVESSGPGAAPEDTDNGNPDDDLPTSATDQTTEAGAPMVMSTLDKNQAKRSRAEKEAKPEREEAAKRVEAAFNSGRIDGPKKRAMLRVANSVEMSFTESGEAGGKKWATFLAELSTVEKKAEHSAWKPTGKRDASGAEMSTTEVDAPNPKGELTPERAQLGCDIILGKKSVKDA